MSELKADYDQGLIKVTGEGRKGGGNTTADAVKYIAELPGKFEKRLRIEDALKAKYCPDDRPTATDFRALLMKI